MVGPWQVIGEVHPIVKSWWCQRSDLEVTPLPEIILQGETLKIEGRMFNGERPIDNPSFNDVIELDVDFFSTNNSAYDNFGAATYQTDIF